MTRGVVYIATGDKYVAEATISARSVRSVMPGLPITLFTDRVTRSDLFDSVELIAEPGFNAGDKVRNIGRTVYDQTVYLDCDTYVCTEFSELFDLLARFDLLVTHDTERTKPNALPIPRAFPEVNTGFLAFTRTGASRFLAEWADAHRKDALAHGANCPDQRTFRSTLFNSDIRFYVLPAEYNCMLWEAAYVCGPVTLLHGRHYLPLAEVSEQANATTGPRVFKAGLGCHQVNTGAQLIAWGAKVLSRKLRSLVSSPMAAPRV